MIMRLIYDPILTTEALIHNLRDHSFILSKVVNRSVYNDEQHRHFHSPHKKYSLKTSETKLDGC